MGAETNRNATVRAFSDADWAAVAELWKAVFADTQLHNEPDSVIQRKLGVQSDLFLVAEVEGRIVGSVLAGYDGVRGWVHYLAVLTEYRGSGIGSALMRAAEDRLQALGCPKLNLQVRAENSGVTTFYEKLGYVTEQRVSMGKLLPEES